MTIRIRRARLLSVACGVALLLIAWSLYPRPPDPEAGDVAAVRRVNFDLRVDSVGVLDAAHARTYASAMRGDKGKIVEIVEDGTRVKENEVLVRFDASPLEADVLRLRADLRTREAAASYVQQALEVEKSQIERALVNAELAARAAGEEAARHQAYIDDLNALERKGVPVGSEIAQAARKAHQAALQQQKAASELALLRREGGHRLAQAFAEVNKVQGEMDNLRHSLELVRDELGKTLVRATAPGFVVLSEAAINDRKRRLRVGDTVWQGQPILYVPDLSSMIVRTRVREEDLHKIREGQDASVRIDAYPELTLRARVVGVGALALESPGVAASGKHFQMTLAVEGRDERLRPGMTARVSIVADRATRVLAVPIPAVFYADDQPVCFVVQEGRPLLRPVSLGRRGDHLVEVTSGLAEGERVSLAKP